MKRTHSEWANDINASHITQAPISCQNLLDLPEDLTNLIFTFLDPPSVWTMCYTCKVVRVKLEDRLGAGDTSYNVKTRITASELPMMVAAASGHTNVLAWLREVNPKWQWVDDVVYTLAARQSMSRLGCVFPVVSKDNLPSASTNLLQINLRQ